ncbi:MAG: signal peptidase II [Anaerolineaceae bacterium]|nr:MAG: signal peptidase II [Anaerolineaceae bacterium]
MKRWISLFITVFFVVGIDQLSKEWIITNLFPYEVRTPIPALGDFFRITYSANTGAAFGMLSDRGDLLTVLALVIIAGLLYYYARIPARGWPTRWGVALVIGGALGNVIDRLRHGEVTDFINYAIPDLFSNVSNLADHAIVLGVIVIIADSLRLERIERAEKAEKARTIEEPAD